MRWRFRMLLKWLIQVLGLRWSGRSGRCAYCGQADKRLYETRGPLGTGGVLVCDECDRACISLTQ
jgi:hypothetical protein